MYTWIARSRETVERNWRVQLSSIQQHQHFHVLLFEAGNLLKASVCRSNCPSTQADKPAPDSISFTCQAALGWASEAAISTGSAECQTPSRPDNPWAWHPGKGAFQPMSCNLVQTGSSGKFFLGPFIPPIHNKNKTLTANMSNCSRLHKQCRKIRRAWWFIWFTKATNFGKKAAVFLGWIHDSSQCLTSIMYNTMFL